MESIREASQRISRISAHLQPPNSQMEESCVLKRADCRAKGGAPGFKVAILGAAGGIGQPLAMLMKMNPLVSVLHLYDVVNTPGVTADIGHMDTGAVVRGFLGQPQLENALTGMDLVIIPAGVPRKPGMTRDDLFNINAGIVRTLCEGIAKCCPNAIVNLISNPSACQAAAAFCKAKGKNISKLAMQYSLANKDISSVLVGMNSVRQVEENVYAATELATFGKDQETLSEVEAILSPVKNQTWPGGIQES